MELVLQVRLAMLHVLQYHTKLLYQQADYCSCPLVAIKCGILCFFQVGGFSTRGGSQAMWSVARGMGRQWLTFRGGRRMRRRERKRGREGQF